MVDRNQALHVSLLSTHVYFLIKQSDINDPLSLALLASRMSKYGNLSYKIILNTLCSSNQPVTFLYAAKLSRRKTSFMDFTQS